MTKALLQQALTAFETDDFVKKLQAAMDIREELAKPDTFKPLGTVYRWTALRYGKPAYQYGEGGYPQLFAKTVVKLPDEPEPAQEPVIQAMSEVADTFAHKLALDLECVLSDCTSSKWYDTAMNTLSAYRSAMNAIHEQESPTFMGEPVMPPCDDDREYLK